MSFLLRNAVLTNVLGVANLAALAAATMYLKSHDESNLAQHEARMDELEGTLRGHIGLVEESLERIEGRKMDGLGAKAEQMYTARGREDKKGK